MNEFMRVSYLNEDGKRRSTILKDVVLSDRFVRGIVCVNHPNGCGWHAIEPAGADERLHLIDLTLVRKMVPMIEDRTYGGLVDAP